MAELTVNTGIDARGVATVTMSLPEKHKGLNAFLEKRQAAWIDNQEG